MKALEEFTYYLPPDANGLESAGYLLDPDAFRWIMGQEGWGMPPIRYITQKGPDQHGETVVDYRLEPRIIQLQVRNDCKSRPKYWAARYLLLNMLRPNRQVSGTFGPGRLRAKYYVEGVEQAIVRDLDVLIQQGPAFSARNLSPWDEWGFTETLRFIAHDPVLYDPIEVGLLWSTLYDPGSYLVDFSLPTSFSIVFGTSAFSFSRTVLYPGSWVSYPTIEITGPVNQFTINNLSTGEFIHLDYNIPAGVTVTISLPFGNKQVVDNFGANLIGLISTDSDLTTFHVAPDPEVEDGENIFTISGTGITAASVVYLHYYNRYIGR